MADLKATSFRVNEEDLEKFKQFMEKEGYKTQAEGFKSIMQSVEMAKAKNMIKDRAKEIEVFQDTINNLMSMFLNSLNVNQTSEERIREELSQELQTKDNTITILHEQLQDTKNENKEFNRLINNYKAAEKILREELEKVNTEINDKQKSIEKLNSNNDLLQEQLKEYKQYREQYKTLEKDLEKLKADYEVLNGSNNKLNNDNDLLTNKVKANGDMINFYKNEIDNKDKSINEYKTDIKVLEDKYSNQIENIKAEHEKTYHEQLKNAIDNLNSKHEVELSKKDLELQKLQNTIDQLKATQVKQPTTKK